jgi:hypothetical protein
VIDDDIPRSTRRHRPRAFVVRDHGGLFAILDQAVLRLQQRSPAGHRVSRERLAREILLYEAGRIASGHRPRR